MANRLLKGSLPARARANEELKYLESIKVDRWGDKDRNRYDFVSRVFRSIADGTTPDDIAKPDGGYFKWPSTEVGGPSRGSAVIASEEVGVLSSVGYKVGANGLPYDTRRTILARVYEQHLSLGLAPTYLSEWGTPRTARRLQKLANTIAALARNMKRRSPMAPSIEDWEADLVYLKRRYYDGRYDFQWPT